VPPSQARKTLSESLESSPFIAAPWLVRAATSPAPTTGAGEARSLPGPAVWLGVRRRPKRWRESHLQPPSRSPDPPARLVHCGHLVCTEPPARALIHEISNYGLQTRAKARELAGGWKLPKIELPSGSDHVHHGVDQGKVRERLGKVAEVPAGLGIELLGVQLERTGV
jgi:hypothetical protein